MIATRHDAPDMRERDHELGLHGLALLRATDEHEVAVHRDAIAQLVATVAGECIAKGRNGGSMASRGRAPPPSVATRTT